MTAAMNELLSFLIHDGPAGKSKIEIKHYIEKLWNRTTLQAEALEGALDASQCSTFLNDNFGSSVDAEKSAFLSLPPKSVGLKFWKTPKKITCPAKVEVCDTAALEKENRSEC